MDIISHIVLDDKTFYTSSKPKSVKSQLGGPAAYSSLIFPFISSEVRVFSAIGADFPKSYLEYLTSFPNCQFHFLNSASTTRFKHEIFSNNRILHLLHAAIKLDDFVSEFKGGEGCLCSPVFKEIGWKALKWAREEHDFLAIDIQGFMRDKNHNNEIVYNFDPEELRKIMKYADFVKLSYDEAVILTNEKNPITILDKLPNNNVQIVTLGENGIVYSNKGKKFSLKAPKVVEKDPTGAGDVFISAFLAKFLETSELDFSLSYGIALATEAVSTEGVSSLPVKDYDKIARDVLNSKVSI
ncbi:MAG: PfkB family carbohydrate kinase [Candidatus Heimdallarchaeaceae archaeon]